MNLKKKSILLALAATMSFGVVVHAETPSLGTTTEPISQKKVIPYINVSGNTYLSTSGFSTVATDNNLVSAEVTVVNDFSNPGMIFAQIVDSNGLVVCDMQMISKGSDYTFSVPHDVGTYKVQCKADRNAGSYNIAVYD